jgi:HSP20 family protein
MNTTVQKKENAKPTVHREEFVAPSVDIFETNEGYVLEAEMPGVNKDGLEITLEGTEITITGRRTHFVPSGVGLISERQPVDFRRTFELDPAIDSGRIGARMNQGVLTLSLPKSERVKPRKIHVTD